MYVADVQMTPKGVARQGCIATVFFGTVQASLEKLQERFMIPVLQNPCLKSLV